MYLHILQLLKLKFAKNGTHTVHTSRNFIMTNLMYIDLQRITDRTF